MTRLFLLILGPPILIGLSYFLTQPDFGHGQAAAASAGPDGSAESRADAVRFPPKGNVPQSSLIVACQRTKETLLERLGSEFRAIVRPPFVIAGDLSLEELTRHHRQTVVPSCRALATAYFDRSPSEPIAIILLSSSETYERAADHLDGQRRAAYAGYYERADRRIVANVSSGDGTIAHELTHALAHVDFPEMPEWFDEGLASLHEESRFSEDGLRIFGSPNWRGRYLVPAIKTGQLRSLESLIEARGVRSDQQALDYAHARYFCLFLQERGLLEPFYRKFRSAVRHDSTGAATLRTLFGVETLATVDQQFRDWAMKTVKEAAPTAKPKQSHPEASPSSNPGNVGR